MAQAAYDESTSARIARTLAQQRAASQATSARAAANLPGATPRAAGISVTDLGSAPTSISGGDITNRAAQLAQQNPAGNVVGGDVPAAARRSIPSVAEVDPTSLSAGERAGFARQGYRFPEPAAPVAPAAPAAAPVAEAPVAAARSGSALGRVARFAGGVAGPALATADAVHSYNTPTENYANRFGGQAGSVGEDVLYRTAGLASDIGAGIADIGPVVVNAAGALIGHNPNIPLASTVLRQNDSPEGGAAYRQAIARFNGADVASRAPSNAGFSDVNAGANTAGAPVTSVAPSIAALPQARSDAGAPLPGRVVNGVRTFSDGSGNPNAPGYVPRTMTQDDIAGLASGNRLSIADSGIGGGIVSEAAGGTVPLGAGPGRSRGYTAEDRQGQLDAINRRGDQAEFDRLMKKSQVELSRGNRKTSQILAGLADHYKTAKEGAPSERAVNIAKANELNAVAGETTSTSARRNSVTNLINQAGTEADPQKRGAIYDTILASEGKDSNRIITVKAPDPSGAVDALGNPVMRDRIFDTRLRKYIDN